MAIKIVTVEEASKVEDLCKKYNEAFEKVIGKAKKDYYCDHTGVEIPAMTKCAVIMVLPSKNHPNYEHQKQMLNDYVY